MATRNLLWHLEEVGRAVLFRPVYVSLTGDLIAGLLLSQIVWWFKPDRGGGSKPSLLMWDGKYWLAKRREDWREEVGISPKQFDRACDHLVALKIVERRVLMRGRAPMVHLSLDSTWLSKLLEPYYRLGKNMDVPQRGRSDVPQRGKSIKEDTFKTKVGRNKTAMGSAKEVQQKLEEKRKLIPDSLPKEQVKPSILAIYWAKLSAREHGGFYPPATKKELGMFAHWVRKVGVDNAYPVMCWAIRNWRDFMDHVQDTTGQKIGTKPTMAALLLHAGAAVTISQQAKEAPAKPVKLIAKKPQPVKFVFDDGEEV